ncbi:glutamine amidotransferase [Marinomonas ushuaiensis DSM 15871]|uniref:Glutamine amidotransferase n=1 Tax=Marinomonas ushuaiensis DSM 15871 TaxID=1122207 RepID=X7E721_9GAMM|nr:glutamine amidotransferase [Marinomonas ushuaiensis]ETX10966.1 glutamine amidotransferase [Marinomonas ushuaiensis DSM 15871]
MKIGILAAGITPDLLLASFPTYADMFLEQLAVIDQSFTFTTYDVRLGFFPESVTECDAWLITGSKSDAYADEAWILRLCEVIKDIDQLKRPLVGICFGHQIIARALGGRVEKFEGGWGVGVHQYQIDESLPMLANNQSIALCAFHQDQVVEKPERARVILRSDFCQNAGLIYDDHILTFQGHPEFSEEYEKELINLYDGQQLTAQQAKEARDTLGVNEIYSLQLMKGIASFLKKPE